MEIINSYRIPINFLLEIVLKNKISRKPNVKILGSRKIDVIGANF